MRIKQRCQVSLSFLLLGGLAFCVSACPDPNEAGGSSTAGDDESGDTGGEMVDDYRTYFIGESVTFGGGGSCNNTDLNTITSTLRNELDDENWKGLRFVDGNTWAEDFQDPNTNPLGLDWVYGDAARLAVYAGHGNVGLLQWGTPSGNGACQMSIPLNARLGTLAGNRAAAVMFMTSCTLRTDALAQTLVANASRQFFGYHNSPYIGYDEPRKVFKRTQDGQSTRDAWLDEMEQNADVGKNSPVVVTFGKSAQDALESHGSTNLASGEGLSTNVGEPADNFIFTWYNNGCSSACGNCSPIPPPQSPDGVEIGAPLPIVELERRVRSELQLLEQVDFMLPFFGVDSTSIVHRSRLAAWATEASTGGEVAFAEISQSPRVSVAYDPVEDRLQITDLDALAIAQPSPTQFVRQPPSHADMLTKLQPVAEHIRDVLQAQSPSTELAVSFNASTREVGYSSPTSGFTGSVPVEYRFELAGRIEGLALPGRSLRVGVSRLGELSSVTSSGMVADVVDVQAIVRTPESALAEFETGLLQEYPDATSVQFFDVTVGYALPEESPRAVVEPSVILRYALTFEDGAGSVMVSRSQAVSLSLVSTCLHALPLTSVDPYPEDGDARHDR